MVLKGDSVSFFPNFLCHDAFVLNVHTRNHYFRLFFSKAAPPLSAQFLLCFAQNKTPLAFLIHMFHCPEKGQTPGFLLTWQPSRGGGA